MPASPHPYAHTLDELVIDGDDGATNYTYYSLHKLHDPRIDTLPYCIRVLLESALRNCDGFQVCRRDVDAILAWETTAAGATAEEKREVEVAFKPARVLLQDFTGVPAVVDFAAMRDCVSRLGGDPLTINPTCPVDLVIDHSVQVDVARTADALTRNQELEFERNNERFRFLKWGAKAFDNMLIVPPGSGIVHQVNLEYLGRLVFAVDAPHGDGGAGAGPKLLYPDSLVGTDSHTTMINGLGILGWGVGGIEAEAVMLGQAISMVLPEVVGYRITGQLGQYVTSTDLVLTITKHLRQLGVVGRCVEFTGPGVAHLSIADRATISRTSPAARYLMERGLTPREFNSYGSRRGNDLVMARGTFANIRLLNKLVGRAGPLTEHVPSGEQMDVYDAAQRYKSEGRAVIVLAGKEYGAGSSRDWAAKGPHLLGIRCVIAESYERIHRSNLIGMGIVPLQYVSGESAETLSLSGRELYTIRVPDPDRIRPRELVTVEVSDGSDFKAVARFDTDVELAYYRHGGILQYMIRSLMLKK